MSKKTAVQVNDFYFMDTHKVRTVFIDEAPWFHASDVCKVLELKNPSQALQQANLQPEDKCIYRIGSGGKAPVFINETGLYLLVMNSRKPSSQPFQRWVTGTVLPTLRKTGAYVMGEENITRPDLKVEQEADKQELVMRTAMRLDGMTARKEWTAAVKDTLMVPRKSMLSVYQAELTDTMYIRLFGDRARALRKQLGVKAKLRDHLNDRDLQKLMVVEGIMTINLDKADLLTWPQVYAMMDKALKAIDA